MIVAGFPSTSGGSGGGSGGGGGLTAACTPSSRTKIGTTASLTTANVVASGSGGTAPYTYAWTFSNGSSTIQYGGSSADTVTANSPASATTNFTAEDMASGRVVLLTATVTVADAASATATANCDVRFERTGV